MIYIGLVRDRVNKRRNLVRNVLLYIINSLPSLLLLTAYRLAMSWQRVGKSFREPGRKPVSLYKLRLSINYSPIRET